jgi:hypothetical protein
VPVSSRIAGALVSVAVIVSLLAGALFVWPGYLATECAPSVVLDGRAYCSEKISVSRPVVVFSGPNRSCLRPYTQLNGTPATVAYGSFEFTLAGQFWCDPGGYGISVKVWEPDGSHSGISVGPGTLPINYTLHPFNWTTSDYEAGFVWISQSSDVTLLIEARAP